MTTWPEIKLLRAILRRGVARFGIGRWSMADDLIDTAFDTVVDSMLNRSADGVSAPRHAYALTILRNLIRSGPHRVGLDRRRVTSLDAPQAQDLVDETKPPQVSERRQLEILVRNAALTPAERTAVLAVRCSTSTHECAARAGMTPRDLRVRLRRAAVKLRRLCS